MLYFVCPDINTGSGGVKQLYRQVDILNKNNIPATIYHKQKGFRCSWFTNTTAVTSQEETRPAKEDIIVLPEAHAIMVGRVFPGVRKVIFNQGCFSTFVRFPLYTTITENPYEHPELLGVITTSEEGENYLKFTFPNTNIHRIKLGINNKLFYPREKKEQICFMPRKLKEDARQIINILRLRGHTTPIKIIENMSEEEVAEAMGESTIFLSFNFREGFGLPPLEAMASGCTVIGYAGGGGKEYFNEYTQLVADGEIIEYVKQIEAALSKESKAENLKKGLAAAKWVKENYSLEQEEKSVIMAWQRILSQ